MGIQEKNNTHDHECVWLPLRVFLTVLFKFTKKHFFRGWEGEGGRVIERPSSVLLSVVFEKKTKTPPKPP